MSSVSMLSLIQAYILSMDGNHLIASHVPNKKGTRTLFRKIVVCLLAAAFAATAECTQKPMTIYLIPGQGGDARLFTHLKIEGDFHIQHIRYERPTKGWSMKDYAKELTKQIDQSEPFIILGVSLGGMLATEMSELVSAEKVIIISSAKRRDELPFRYRFQKQIPIHRLVPPKLALFGAKVLQPIVEPDRQTQKDIFKAMLRDKDPIFLDRTIEMIVTWDRRVAPENVIHVHGSNDHTIPIRNVDYDYCLEGGTHMMTLTQAKDVSALVNEILTSE